MEIAAAAFAAGAFVGAVAKSMVSAHANMEPLIPPPPPPPLPPTMKKAKTRIFYKMDPLPLTANGEDSRKVGDPMGQEIVVLKKTTQTPQRLAVTDGDICRVVLKRAPALLTAEEKKASFDPGRTFFPELLQRLHTLQPQQ